jgi:hypothetical protein
VQGSKAAGCCFSHFFYIFDHQGNLSLTEKKDEKHLKSSTFFSNLLVIGVILNRGLSLAISTITDPKKK